MPTARKPVLTIDTLNPHVKNVEYAVRGELAIRAEELKNQLHQGQKLPFNKVINCNIGNPQSLEQSPISFFRQVAALTEYPELVYTADAAKKAAVSALFPTDAIARARTLLESCGGAIGAYSHSQGIPAVRKHVAQFITERDGGFAADPNHIFLTSGASSGVQQVLQSIIEHDKVGIMIPIPQYPLYTATLSLYNARAVPYLLDETKEWGMDVAGLEHSLREARSQGTDVRALVIINPGNPTGQCLSEENMREIVKLCHRERLILLADEVYQTNIYQPETRPFHSFKKVLRSIGGAVANETELFSFHSISKGMIGECGRRGGYFECTNIDPQIIEQLYKIASTCLCPNVPGQLLVDLMVRPPQPADPSYAQYTSEISEIFTSLQRRALRLCDAFNHMEGVSCNNAQGAMYLFPRIRLPKKAIKAAEEVGKKPDDFYSMALLNATGVCVVPGSGFGQEPDTWHFRSTFLPPEKDMQTFIDLLGKFHADFMNKYRD